MKLLVEIQDDVYKSLKNNRGTAIENVMAIAAVIDGQILPDGCEILTKEAYADLCMRASKGNCSEIPTGSTAKIDVPDNNVGDIDCISRSDALRVAKNEYLRGWHNALCKALSEKYSIYCEEGNFSVIQEETITGLGLSMNCALGKDVESYMSTMPSMAPQEPRWIPCSEKKPDKGGKYLLWGKIDESEEEDYCFIGDYHEFDEVFGTEISNYDPKTLGFIDTEIEEYYSVVAWMPMPESYRRMKE